MKYKEQIAAAAMALSLVATGCGAKTENSSGEGTGTVSDGYVLVSQDKDYTPLYAEPSIGSEKVAEMYDKKQVTVFTLQDGWYYVSYNGQRGYVQEERIAFTLTNVMEQEDEETEDKADVTEAPETTAKKTTTSTTVTTEEPEETETEETETETEPAEETEAPEETEATEETKAPEETEAPAETDRPARYSVFICEDDIIAAAKLTYTDYIDFCTLTNLSCNNGDATPVTENIIGNSLTFHALRGIRVNNVTEGSLSVSGTLTLHRWEWANAEHTARTIYDEKVVNFTFTMDVKK